MEILRNETQNTPVILPEPTVSGSFGHGWEMMKKNLPELLLVIFLQILLALPTGLGSLLFPVSLSGELSKGLFNLIYSLIIAMPVSYGASWIYLKAVRGEAFRVPEIFFAYQRLGQVILANLLSGIIIGAGIILLIVPGIIFACKLAFVPYLVMDEKMSATDAISKSWRMTTGHTGTIFLMAIVSFFVALGGIICLIIGIFPAVVWISLAFASLYWTVSVRQKQAAQAI